MAVGLFLCYQITHPNSSYEEIPRELREEMLAHWPTDQFGQRFLDGKTTVYYGTHGDCVAFFFRGLTELSHHRGFEVAEYEFTYSNYFEIMVYHDGAFAPLDEAYERGWLSKRQISSIYHYHKNNRIIYDLFGF